ncbi:Cytochrome c oxidase subunit 3 [BD1-7 clade bacterium]|uniref:cytochrome-c oxidase n=1 Tax=BD1-7 clade bacterium TaxID=2029982 RepID=A0A5S9QT93_9GAMM|nr:Cytochrome c oxidase subunit 3 [BD1-7 clade bacterium]CAA0121997.1 Cytochrome c oxidase subunit 3 [BD1-7 clade bacterium]
MQNHDADAQPRYYVPEPSHWPIVASIGLFCFFVGLGNWLHYKWYGPYIFFVGFLIIVMMMFGWFAKVITENKNGAYQGLEGTAFRRGMIWFITSEVFFFSTFFGSLFFTRIWSIPLLGGDIYPLTNILIWPDFSAVWPLISNPDNTQFLGAKEAASPSGIPVLNTLLLLSSGGTITMAHHALKHNKRKALLFWMVLTILLGATFLGCQAFEYYESYTERGLTLNSGVYGSMFFLLTGFHGAHVTIGVTMLAVILVRCALGHFTPERHFAFQGVAWYWHFVDVVWIMLFFFVYWF